MTINYDDLFENIGEYVQRINDFEAMYAALDTDYSEIKSELNTNGRDDVLNGEYDRFERYKGQVLTWIGEMKQKITELLTHKTTVLDELNLGSDTGINRVFAALFRDMIVNSESIAPNTVTIGSITATETNANAGTILVDKTLDGTNSPGAGFQANREYDGIESQLAFTDSILVECISDSETSGVTEGNERFSIAGKNPSPDPYHWRTYGSGNGPQIGTIQGLSILSGCEFESFSSNVPVGFTVDSGTAGTHIFEESTTVYRGDAALKLLGDASQASIQLSQDASTLMLPKQRYCVAFWVRGTTGMSAGTLTIQFEGTGYTASSSEKIEMDSTALAAATSYTLKHFYVNPPAEIPDDWKLVIKLTGTPSAHEVYVDGGGVATPTWFNGVNIIAVAGSDPFLLGDRYAFTLTNDDDGVFQTMFRKAFGVQLPSDASPTNADSLAT